MHTGLKDSLPALSYMNKNKCSETPHSKVLRCPHEKSLPGFPPSPPPGDMGAGIVKGARSAGQVRCGSLPSYQEGVLHPAKPREVLEGPLRASRHPPDLQGVQGQVAGNMRLPWEYGGTRCAHVSLGLDVDPVRGIQT